MAFSFVLFFSSPFCCNIDCCNLFIPKVFFFLCLSFIFTVLLHKMANVHITELCWECKPINHRHFSSFFCINGKELISIVANEQPIELQCVTSIWFRLQRHIPYILIRLSKCWKIFVFLQEINVITMIAKP